MGGMLEYQEKNKLKVSELRITQRGCDRPYLEADDIIYDAIQETKSHRLRQKEDQFQLRLSTSKDMHLLFYGIPTPELKYGEATQRFIELRVNTTPCKENLCFQWREVKYTETLERVPITDNWSTDFPGMEGFSPGGNHNYILRLNEYQTPNGKLWILDLMVQERTRNKGADWRKPNY
jgi:hypothetical protein